MIKMVFILSNFFLNINLILPIRMNKWSSRECTLVVGTLVILEALGEIFSTEKKMYSLRPKSNINSLPSGKRVPYSEGRPVSELDLCCGFCSVLSWQEKLSELQTLSKNMQGGL